MSQVPSWILTFRRTTSWIAWAAVPVVGLAFLVNSSRTISRYRAEQQKQSANAYKFEWSSILPPGSSFPDVLLGSEAGTESSRTILGGRWTYVICVPSPERTLVDFASIVADRFVDKKLQFLFILPAGAKDSGLPDGARGRLNAAFDAEGALTGRLHLPAKDYAWFMLVDPQGIVRFSVPRIPSNNDIRQLTERTFYGKPTEQFTFAGRGYDRGARIPDVEVQDVSTGRQRSLSDVVSGGKRLIFFRANCTSCGTDATVARLENIERTQADDIVPLFSRSYRREELREAKMSHSIARPIYVATAFIPDWEDPYITLVSNSTSSQLIEFSTEGKVIETQDFDEWYRSILAISAKIPVLDPPVAASGRRTVLIDPHGPQFGFIKAVAESHAGELYLLDKLNHRILVLSPERLFSRSIGGIGQGAADFYQPLALTVWNQNLYVVDQDGARMQIIGTDGVPVSRFWLSTQLLSDAIAVTRDGLVVLNTPRQDQLLTLLDQDGKEIRRFGELLSGSEAFGLQGGAAIPRSALGRAHLLSGSGDSIITVFQFAPVVRRYGLDGRLQWQVRLRGASVDHFAEAFAQFPGIRPRSPVKSIDGSQLPYVITSAALTPEEDILVMFADRSTCLVNSAGEQLSCTQWGTGTAFSAIVSDSKGLLFATPGGISRPELNITAR